MHIRDSAAAKRFSPDKMVKSNLFDSPNLFCDLYCLEPGQSQKVHAHEGADKLYFVLEGVGTFLVGGATADHGPGTLVAAPSGVPHGVENRSRDRLTLLVTMAPSPNFPKR